MIQCIILVSVSLFLYPRIESETDLLRIVIHNSLTSLGVYLDVTDRSLTSLFPREKKSDDDSLSRSISTTLLTVLSIDEREISFAKSFNAVPARSTELNEHVRLIHPRLIEASRITSYRSLISTRRVPTHASLMASFPVSSTTFNVIAVTLSLVSRGWCRAHYGMRTLLSLTNYQPSWI